MQSLLILGRQPELGLAEIESLYGADKLQPLNHQAVIVDIDPCRLAFDRLGGSLKFCKVLTTLDTTNWSEIEQFLIKVSPEQAKAIPEGKMTLGLSLYNFSLVSKDIMATGLKLKRAISKSGRTVRFVPNKEPSLNTAQVIHNNLLKANGWELILVKANHKTVIAQSVKVQNINAYARRDQARPSRDAKVGMLPPKLAQIMVNLSVGQIPEDKLESICDIPEDHTTPPPDLGQVVLDPFCGSGVILQEARLMGYGVYGTDIDRRMVSYSKDNLSWLDKHFKTSQSAIALEMADATEHKWSKAFDFVASETYLGPAYSSPPGLSQLESTIDNCSGIIKKFLNNIHSQIKPGSRLCLALPAWQIKPNQFKRLPLIDQISALGYNHLSFEHAGQTLIYARPSQIVARELIVITRKSLS